MGAQKLNVVTPHEVQKLSLDAIEVLPELLQTRADISPAWVKRYADRLFDTEPPPVVVFRTPDGRMVLSAGFHRYHARWHFVELLRKAGKPWQHAKFIPAIVKEGTIQDALLFSIEDNLTEFHEGREVSENDRMHAAAMMIRNGAGEPGAGTWDWSDMEIGRRCGLGKTTARKIRFGLRDEENVPLPSVIHSFKDGKPTGKTVAYGRLPDGKPRIIYTKSSDGWRDDFKASIGGKKVYLGSDYSQAEAKLDSLLASREKTRAALDTPVHFRAWLMLKRIHARGLKGSESKLGGSVVGNVLMLAVPSGDQDVILREIGRGAVLRHRLPNFRRIMLVGYFDKISSTMTQAIEDVSPFLEFMTPEEVVAEFGPKEAGADG
jgi:hypothetical protein